MLCYISTKNENCNFLKILFMASVSLISEQPSYFMEWKFFMRLGCGLLVFNVTTCRPILPLKISEIFQYTWNEIYFPSQMWQLIDLRNECLFFWVHGEWIGARDKQIVWTVKRFSGDLFVPCSDSFPMNPEKRHSFLIFTVLPSKTLSKIRRGKLWIQIPPCNGYF